VSKNRKSKKAAAATNQQAIPVIPLIVLAVVLIAGVGAFVFFTTVPPTVDVADLGSGEAVAAASSPQVINANQYNADFLESEADHILIDVRTPGEFAQGHIEGAININVQEIGQRLDEIPTDKPIVLYCRSGNRSSQAARILDNAGLENIYDLGGIISWTAAGYETVR